MERRPHRPQDDDRVSGGARLRDVDGVGEHKVIDYPRESEPGGVQLPGEGDRNS